MLGFYYEYVVEDGAYFDASFGNFLPSEKVVTGYVEAESEADFYKEYGYADIIKTVPVVSKKVPVKISDKNIGGFIEVCNDNGIPFSIIKAGKDWTGLFVTVTKWQSIILNNYLKEV